MRSYIKIIILTFFIGISINLYSVNKDNLIINKKCCVLNHTKITYLDTICHAALFNLDIKGINIYIYYINDNIKNKDLDLLMGNLWYNNNNEYFIFIKRKLDYNTAIKILTHEITHINQYYNNKLIFKDNIIIWNGETYDLNLINYSNRPWEIDAFLNGDELYIKTYNLLKKYYFTLNDCYY